MQFDYFAKKLEEKKAELETRLNRLRSETGPLDRDSSEAALELESEEVSEELDREARTELTQIYRALDCIKLGTYGLCVECQNPIPIKRLEALPFTQLCMNCATMSG